MMRSLWSGVSGMQAHQIAIDVEGNNIANVNTTGFKYSRANFSDMLSQTSKVATGPRGALGGQNSMQVGLGTTISSTQRIHTQGTLTTTENKSDIALQGNGYFIVSPDGGTTRYYTRNGEFLRDSAGNFVNSAGYIVQGWVRDEATNSIDTTGPIQNVVIKEGLTTPARATTEVSIKGNLDSGNTIGTRSSPIYMLDSVDGGRDFDSDGLLDPTEIHSENDTNDNEFFTNSRKEQVLTERGVDLGVTFNELGNGLALRDGQGIWISYANAETGTPFTIGSPAAATIGQFLNAGGVPENRTLNITLNGTVIQATVSSITEVASAINAQYAKTGVRAEISAGNKLTLINRNDSGTTENTKNIHLVVDATDKTGLASIDIITAYQYTYSSTTIAADHSHNDGIARRVNTTEDLRRAMQTDARRFVDYNGDGKLAANLTASEQAQKAQQAYAAAYQTAYNTSIENGLAPAAATAAAQAAGQAAAQAMLVAEAATLGTNDYLNAYNAAGNYTAGIAAIQALGGADLNDGVKFTVNSSGQFQLENPKNDNADHALYFTVTGLTKEASGATPAVNENTALTTIMGALEGALNSGQALRTSGALMMSSHGSTAEIYDSLGSKHTISVKWAKTGTTSDGGTEWGMLIQVPEPAEINFSGEGPKNVITGSMRFNSDGSLASFNPATITFTANNGSTAGQSVKLNFGLGTDFDGLTSFDKDSETNSIKQDGYAGGTLTDYKVDESGTVIGVFSNGRSIGLAQIAVATFTNNEGLNSEGGNMYSMTSNSGEAIIGAAGTSDKGSIVAGKLEASNVDLSRALTQLIVIQRGYQANSKTITTSDEMLNTLLQLKN